MLSDPGNQDLALDELIARCLEAEEAGEPIPIEGALRQNPQFFEPLSQFLTRHQRLQRIAQPLRTAARIARAAEASGPITPTALPARFGSFELLEVLGRGGNGVVYRARQQTPNRAVAIKILRADPLLAPDEVSRFCNEAELVARLDHAHIVPVYETGSHAGQLYCCMKLLEGGSLAAHLDHYRGDPRAAASLVIAVARAIHHAHQRGILHRDLKPSNILLDAEGRPHVADFGLGKSLHTADASLTPAGMLIGTPAYIAPELVMGQGGLASTAADVYGLGTILYALLTGQPPYRGDGPFDTVLRVSSSDPVAPRAIDAGIDADLETICLTAMAREPERRYASAQALAEDLERWLSGHPILARPATAGEKFRRWCRRNPAIAALTGVAAALLLMIVAGLATGVILLRRERADALRHQRRAEEQEGLATDKARDLRRHLYASQMNQAWRAWEAGDLWQARKLVELQTPAAGEDDLRGFEWRFLRGTCLGPRLEKAILAEHTGPTFGIAFSPDGKLLATASEDRTAGIWDIASRRRLFTLPGKDDDHNSVAFHPKGTLLVTTSEDGWIWTWDVATGRQRELRAHLPSAVSHAAFSPDGRRLAVSAYGNDLRIYPFPDNDRPAFDEPRILKDAHHNAEAVSFSPDGKMLASCGRDGTAKLWDVATGACLHVLKHTDEVVKGLAFAHRLPLLATASYDGSVSLWNTTTGKLVRKLEGNFGLTQGVSFAPNDEMLASCHDSGSVCLWEVARGSLRTTYVGHGTRTWAIAFSPDGKTLASADHEGRVLFWDPTPSDARRLLFDGKGRSLDCEFLPDGKTVALAGAFDGAVRLIDSATGKIHKTLPQPGLQPASLACSADGNTLLAGYADGSVRLWDVERERCRLTIQAGNAWMPAVGLTPDGRTVLTLGPPDALVVWDAATGNRLHSITLEQAKVSTFARAGRTLVTRHDDGRIALWDMANLDEPQRILPARFPFMGDPVALSVDGKLLAVQALATIELWDVDGNAPRQLLAGGSNTAKSLAFSPDARTLVSATRSGVKLWHVATGQELMTLPETLANTVRFSPDGRMLLICAGGSLIALDAPRNDER